VEVIAVIIAPLKKIQQQVLTHSLSHYRLRSFVCLQVVSNDHANENSDSKNKQPCRKAANLSELQRYLKAAQEAAREVLNESNNENDNIQMRELINTESPRAIMSLHSFTNPRFKEVLKQKLEKTGFSCGPYAYIYIHSLASCGPYAYIYIHSLASILGLTLTHPRRHI